MILRNLDSVGTARDSGQLVLRKSTPGSYMIAQTSATECFKPQGTVVLLPMKPHRSGDRQFRQIRTQRVEAGLDELELFAVPRQPATRREADCEDPAAQRAAGVAP